MMPPQLSGFGSDSDSDDGGGGGGLSCGVPPVATTPGGDKNAYALSQSGAFKLADFELRPTAGLTTLADSSPEHAHPEELALASVPEVPALEVQSLSDLEMLGELGAGGDAQPLDGLLRVLKVLRQHARALAVDQVQLALALPLHCVHCAFRPA